MRFNNPDTPETQNYSGSSFRMSDFLALPVLNVGRTLALPVMSLSESPRKPKTATSSEFY